MVSPSKRGKLKIPSNGIEIGGSDPKLFGQYGQPVIVDRYGLKALGFLRSVIHKSIRAKTKIAIVHVRS